MKNIMKISNLLSKSGMRAVAAGVLLLPLIAPEAALAVTRSCNAEYRIWPTEFSGTTVKRPFSAQANALGPNTARRDAYEKIQDCVTRHWGGSSPDWPVACRPVNGVNNYPFRRLENDIPSAMCAANPGRTSMRVHVELQITGNTGCENPHAVNDWGITVLSRSYPVSCPNAGGQGGISHATNTNRPGMDYRNLPIPSHRWRDCAKECLEDSRCQAWTYVKPGIQGAQARCWLKDGVPQARPDSCCVSGVTGRGLE